MTLKPLPADLSAISEITVRVNYSETDQMGVVYHAWYLPWLDRARTEHLRRTGVTYREMEEMGFRLAVADVRVRYRIPARYDDLVTIRCWVRDIASRLVSFGYAIERAETTELLATAMTDLICLDRAMRFTRLPDEVHERLRPAPDPVKLW